MNNLPAPTKIAVQIPAKLLRRGDWIFDHGAKTWREVTSALPMSDGRVMISSHTGLLGVCHPETGVTISFVE